MRRSDLPASEVSAGINAGSLDDSGRCIGRRGKIVMGNGVEHA
ncbi:putative RNA-binding protein YlqC (UPF0109 family) [Pseudomonas lini]|nr:putative RNA-binding protein YlqC (UPF0109 family) [Pseudomonas lini]